MSRRTWTAVRSALCTSSRMAALPDDSCRLFFAQILLVCDSYGCIDARPHKLLATVWPLLGKTVEETARCARELERAGLAVRRRDASAEWLEVPDWEEKQGELIRKRGKRTFGVGGEDPEHGTDGAAEVDQESSEGRTKGGEVPDAPGVALTSIVSSLPSSLAGEPSGASRFPRARASSPPAPDRPTALTDRAREQLEHQPTLKTTEVCAALVRWENHLRDHGKLDSWRSGTWASNLTTWATWGPARLVRAIDTTIRAGKFTPFEPRHGDAPAPAAKPEPAAVHSQAERAKRERDIERAWESRHTVEREMPGIDGSPVVRLVLDAKYPGHEAAERELREAGLLNGHASAMPATAGGSRT